MYILSMIKNPNHYDVYPFNDKKNLTSTMNILSMIKKNPNQYDVYPFNDKKPQTSTMYILSMIKKNQTSTM